MGYIASAPTSQKRELRHTLQCRFFLAVGALGGYTTFSTFNYETLALLSDGNIQAFLFNAIGQLAAGLLAVYLGIVLCRSLGGVR